MDPPFWTLHFDGSCEPTNPGGYACWAWVLRTPDGEVYQEDYGFLVKGRGATCNLAEFSALESGLAGVVEAGLEVPLRLLGDSMLVVRTVGEEWNLRAPHLVPIRRRIFDLLEENGRCWCVRWIPREENAYADSLCDLAYADQRRKEGHATAPKTDWCGKKRLDLNRRKGLKRGPRKTQ